MMYTNKTFEHDRGAFSQLTFTRCVRGFTLTVYDMERDSRAAFAFDRVEDLAAWLVEQYCDLPDDDGCVKAEPSARPIR
jgi:hypothetical protein